MFLSMTKKNIFLKNLEFCNHFVKTFKLNNNFWLNTFVKYIKMIDVEQARTKVTVNYTVIVMAS